MENNAWIFGLRLSADTKEFDLYFAMIEGQEDDFVLKNDSGYVIFSQSRDKIENYLKERNISFTVEGYCDLASVFYLLSDGVTDEECLLLNSINVLLDLVKATELEFNPSVKSNLFALADYLTFDKSIESFFTKNSSVSRKELIESVYLSLGLVFSKVSLCR